MRGGGTWLGVRTLTWGSVGTKRPYLPFARACATPKDAMLVIASWYLLSTIRSLSLSSISSCWSLMYRLALGLASMV